MAFSVLYQFNSRVTLTTARVPFTSCSALALTPFSALRDLRPIAEISDLLGQAAIAALDVEAAALRAQPDAAGLRSFLRSLFALEGARLDRLLEQLRAAVERLAGDATFDCVGRLLEVYPRDAGVLAPLFMQRVVLEPGQALFQPPGMLHCYLEGAAVEVMADSDNVARAALTSKKVDVDEVLRLLAVEGGSPELVDARRLDERRLCYAPAVAEFSLTELALRAGEPYVGGSRESVELWVCVEGEAAVSAPPAPTLRIRAGESVLVPAAVEQYSVEGSARIYIASVPLAS